MMHNIVGWNSVGCGGVGGFNIFGTLYSLLFLAMLVLLVAWLYKQVFPQEKKRR